MEALFASVLVGTDFSDAADAAVTSALATLRPRGTLHLVHVLPSPPPGELPTPFPADVRARIAALSEKATLVVPGATVTTRIAMGAVAPTLVRLASELAVELVLLGTHGRGRGHRLCGSVAEAVMRGAPCRVLTVPAAAPRQVAARSA
jgi:nucleotide-binding universal stress UspA family protein